MSRLAHVMCEACFKTSSQLLEDVELTDAHDGRRCCWCQTTVEFALILHRHPRLVPCKGKHGIHKTTTEA